MGKIRVLGQKDVFLLCLILCFFTSSAQAKYGGGSGTAESPYLISEPNHMQAVGADFNDWDKHFKMTADIDLAAFAGTQFNIIGDSSIKFTGVFDGNNHTVSNFIYNSTGTNYIGLFRYIDGPNAVIKNIGLINPQVSAGTGTIVGSLAGSLSAGSVSGCYVEGGDVSGRHTVGALVGVNLVGGTISNCFMICDVNGVDQVGGLVGENYGMVIDSYAMGSISGSDKVGGLTGWNFGTVTNCYATGSVAGGEFASYVGGLIGRNSNGIVSTSFWDTETALPATSSAGGTGLTTAEMMVPNTFLDTGWDFVGEATNGPNDIWTICDCGGNYPRLIWEEPRVYYVDAVEGNDNDYGLRPASSFATIQAGIDIALGCETVSVQPGEYAENINFSGYPITLTSIDPVNPKIVNDTVIEGYVQFSGTEDANCTFTGFKIQDISDGAIYGNHTHATISYCIISGNGPCSAIVMMNCDGTISNCLIADNTYSGCGPLLPAIFGCGGLIKNCTITSNVSGVSISDGKILTMENCIIYNNGGSQVEVVAGSTLDISYCNLQGGLGGISGSGEINEGLGNIDTDPCFVNAANGNYHLKSNGWRRLESMSQWVYDDITSRCIDAGNPGSPLGDELLTVPRDPDNDYGINLRVNMGAYGGTIQASMAPYDWAFLADLSNDGVVDYIDLAGQTEDWLISANEQPGDLNRDGIVNMKDFAAFADDWLQVTDWAE